MAGEAATLLPVPTVTSSSTSATPPSWPSGGSDSSVFSTLSRVFSDRLVFGGGCEGGGGRPGGAFWPVGACELADIGETLEGEEDLGVSV